MTPYRYILVAVALLPLPACEQNSNSNRTDGVKDALDVRSNEKLRDAGEDMEDAVKDVGRDIKDAVQDK